VADTPNRWPDVCALCDRPIDMTAGHGWRGLHLYVGPGFVHGVGRENIPVHYGCIYLAHLDGSEPVYPDIVAAIGGDRG